ncbi:GAF domain-containing sensor histidine kinase [uncultured Roseivirga sp.]|uniref:GAF domain-containing sensor histidine kinase n=1 Tax=uncultured Roseivirga sp. TaxID=543088 RepID=UPI000D7A4BC9|nr:GAF domain-containing sensor histidine kinase [uncultured Roseivirga sp.]PWL31650.1 MAG: hypothetical protein DCO95_00255 [Roseivirga sp. XM-24bin3]
MKIPKTAKREESRLETLIAYRILDTPQEQEFDIITEISAELFNTPVSTISFIDKDRVWYKSVVGLNTKETKRFEAVCAEILNDDNDILEIEDLSNDPKFSTSTVFIDDKSLKFYAGAPIKDRNGFTLGTLCVMDTKPRRLSDIEKSRLKNLSNMVMRQIEHRLIQKHLNQYVQLQTAELQKALINLRNKVSETQQEKAQLISDLQEEKDFTDMRAQLVQSISKQFRSPLTTITSSAQLIEMITPELSAGMDKHLNRILGSVKNIAEMMDDVLYFHELDLLNLHDSATEINITKLVYTALDRAKLECQGRNEFQVDCLEEETLKFYSNKEGLEMLLKVFLSNAIKYSTIGSIIKFQYSVTSESFQFNINTKGATLKKSELKQIFDLFYRGDNSANTSGLGIGLTTARKLISSLNGQIKVESTSRDGTTFYVLIPAFTQEGQTETK